MQITIFPKYIITLYVLQISLSNCRSGSSSLTSYKRFLTYLTGGNAYYFNEINRPLVHC